jgi:DNA polymerase-1
MSPSPSLHLIDGSAYLFRAYHALPKLSNAAGEPTGALFGVVNMIRRWLVEHGPSRIAFVFDHSGKTFRNELYSQYKANRPPTPDDLKAQVAPLLQIVEAMGLPVLRIPGVEADDVIGTLTKRARAAGMDVLISTGDKDLTQLIEPGVRWLNTMTGDELDADGVFAKFGVRPDQIIDYLALVGDSVDNIPGVDKCGPVTAAKWLKQYDTLDNIMAHASEVGGKIGENLRAALDRLPLSRSLATVRTDCELPLGVEDLSLRPADVETLKSLYSRYEFIGALKDLDASAVVESSAGRRQPKPVSGAGFTPPDLPESLQNVEKHYDTVRTLEQLDHWLARLQAAELIAFDTETDALDGHNAGLVGISLAVAPGQACYIPLTHRQTAASSLLPDQLPMDTVIAALKPLLEDPAKPKCGLHAKYDIHVLRRHGIDVKGVTDDAMLASYVLNSTYTQHNMDALCQKYLDYKTITFNEVAGKGAKQITFDQVDIERASTYAAEDADVTLRLTQLLSAALAATPKVLSIYRDMEIPLIPVLARMEHYGIRIDVDELRRQSAQLGAEMHQVQQQAFELIGRPFSLESPKQLQGILFDELRLKPTQRTPTGQPSTNEDALEELTELHPLPKLILEFRGLTKLKSTYTDKLAQLADTGSRVHTSFHQAIAATGRLSSSDPNLQNIPIRTEQGRRIRKAFVAPPGWKLLAADYSQIELRIMAHISGDTAMLEAFANGVDIHRATAAEVLGLKAEDVTGDQRRSAKAINFGLIYGMSAFGLAKNLSISRTEAGNYVKQYFARFPGVKRYMDDTRKTAHEQGYVETLFGRRLYLPDLKSRQRGLIAGAERAAINAPMQGTAADIIKRAMIDVDQWLLGRESEIRMLLQVHDELVFEVREDCVEQYREEIATRMSAGGALKVPLAVEVGVGDSWFEAH